MPPARHQSYMQLAADLVSGISDNAQPLPPEHLFAKQLAELGCHHPRFVAMDVTTRTRADTARFADMLAAIVSMSVSQPDISVIGINGQNPETGSWQAGIAIGSTDPKTPLRHVPKIDLQVLRLRESMFGKKGDLPKDWKLMRVTSLDGSAVEAFVRDFPKTAQGQKQAQLTADIAFMHGAAHHLEVPQDSQIQLREAFPEGEKHRESQQYSVIVPVDEMQKLMSESLSGHFRPPGGRPTGRGA